MNPELNFAQACMLLGLLLGLIAGVSLAELWRAILAAGLPAAPRGEQPHLDNSKETYRTAYPSGRGTGDAHAR